MKRKRITVIAGVLVFLMLWSSVVFAAPLYETLKAYYGVALVANGQVFTPDDSTRPFVANGRTYVSLAALRNMGLLDVDYDAATKIVTLSSGSTPAGDASAQLKALQDQVAALTAEKNSWQERFAICENENVRLRQESVNLRGLNPDLAAENNRLSQNNAVLRQNNVALDSQVKYLQQQLDAALGRKPAYLPPITPPVYSTSSLASLPSADKTYLENLLMRDLARMSASTVYSSRQAFDADTAVSINANVVEVTLRDRTLRVNDWNALLKRSSTLEADYYDFFNKQMLPTVKKDLTSFKDYTVKLTVLASPDVSSNYYPVVDENGVPYDYRYVVRDAVNTVVRITYTSSDERIYVNFDFYGAYKNNG